MDLDQPAAHADLLDDQAQEALAGIQVELVERCGDALVEAREALAVAVLAGELGAALARRCLLGAELVAAGSELLAAPGARIAAYLESDHAVPRAVISQCSAITRSMSL